MRKIAVHGLPAGRAPSSMASHPPPPTPSPATSSSTTAAHSADPWRQQQQQQHADKDEEDAGAEKAKGGRKRPEDASLRPSTSAGTGMGTGTGTGSEGARLTDSPEKKRFKKRRRQRRRSKKQAAGEKGAAATATATAATGGEESAKTEGETTAEEDEEGAEGSAAAAPSGEVVPDVHVAAVVKALAAVVAAGDDEEDPQPGPSTSAAQFDLEVFDSGSSCSIEDCCWSSRDAEEKLSSLPPSTSAKIKQAKAKSSAASTFKKSNTGSKATADQESRPLPPPSQSATEVAEAAMDGAMEDRDTVDGGDVQSGSGALAAIAAPVADVVPISACPSETEDDEGEENASGAGSTDASILRGESPVASTSKTFSLDSAVAGPSSATATSSWENSAALSEDAGADNIDEIVQDHDNFGTDENEDSMDATGLPVTLPPSTLPLRVPATLEEPLSLGEVDSSNAYLSAGTKRKSDDGAPAVPPGSEDNTLLKVKKQCIEEAFREQKEQEERLQNELVLCVGKSDAAMTPPASQAAAAPLPSASPSLPPGQLQQRSKFIPDKENPPQGMADWIATFSSWSHADRLLAIDQLISASQPSQVRHMLAVIEPQFQRDFISLLPKELALYVLSFLSPRDLLRAAQTCRCWRILCEDNLLWREKCRESGVDYDIRAVMFTRIGGSGRSSGGPGPLSDFLYSPHKTNFMRQHNIEMNWRMRPIRSPKVLKGHDEHVITCLQFNDNKIVSGSDDNTLKVWSAQTGKCLRTLVGHTGGVWSSQMEGDTIVSGSTDRTLKVWNSETGGCEHTLYGHTSTVRCMHLHKKKVVSGSRDATLRLWDISSGECLHVLIGHVAAVRCVQYDGRLIVSGAYDYMVKVWNPEREECIHTLAGHTNRVYSLQFDGAHVVSGSLDTSIRVWDVETGSCRHALMGHQSLTSGMELRNNILVSGNADSTVKVWDIITGQCLQTLSGPNKHQSAVTCLQFNSKFVITSSDDGTVKLWDVKTGEFIRDLVALASGGSGGVVWRIRANSTKLICAVGSRNGTEETKLLVLDFDASSPAHLIIPDAARHPSVSASLHSDLEMLADEDEEGEDDTDHEPAAGSLPQAAAASTPPVPVAAAAASASAANNDQQQ